MAEFTTPSPATGIGSRRAGAESPIDVPDINPAVARDPGVRATPQDFGADVGIATQQVAQTGMQAARGLGAEAGYAAYRLQNRLDAIENGKLVRDYKTRAADALRQAQTGADLAKPEGMAAFGKILDDIAADGVKNYGGSEGGLLRLQAEQENLRGAFSDQAATAAYAIQKNLVNQEANQIINENTARVIRDPTALRDSWTVGDTDLKKLAPAFNPAELVAHQQMLRSETTKAATERYLSTPGGVGAAKDLINQDGMDKILGADVQRHYNNRIIIMESENTKLARDAHAREALWADAMGIPVERLPMEVKLAAAQYPFPSNRPQTTSEKVADLEDAVHKVPGQENWRAPLEVVQKLGGVPVSTDPHRQNLDIMTKIAPKIIANVATPEERNLFESSVTDYSQIKQPQTVKDEYSGQMMFFPGSQNRLPPQAQQAADIIGLKIPAFGQQQQNQGPFVPPPPSQPQLPSLAGNQSNVSQSQPQIQPPGSNAGGIQQPIPVPGPGAPPPAPTGSVPPRDLWKMAAGTTGPIPAAIAGAASLPFVGQYVPAGRVIQDRKYVSGQIDDLVRVLSARAGQLGGANPKEIQHIRDEFSIDPELIDNSKAYLERLVAIDENLMRRQNNAYQTGWVNPGAVSPNEVRHARDVFQTITQFRTALNVPPRMTAQAVDAAVANGQLKPGDPFVTTKGEVLRAR